MKKIILLSVFLSISYCFVFGQVNLLPTNTPPNNVGIGTLSPLEKLHIQNGNLLIAGNTAFSTSMGAIKFSTATYNYAWAGISASTNGEGMDQLDLLFYSAYGSPMERMRLMANTGYLGIGTSAPAAKVHSMSTGEQLRLGYDATNYSSFVTSSTGGLTISPSAGTFNLTGSEIYLTDNESGQNQNSNSTRLNFIGNGQKAGFGIQALNITSYGTKDLVFYAHNGILHNDYTSYDEVVRFMYNGNVGINNSSPTAKLDVRGDARFGDFGIPLNSSGGLSVRIGLIASSLNNLNSTDAFIGALSTGGPEGLAGDLLLLPRSSTGVNNAIRFYTGPTTPSERLTIAYSGNIGINNNNPIAKLDVKGNIYSDGKIYIGTSDATTATNMGNNLLAVDGPAIFKKVTVKAALWPDYVFTPTYNLPTLDSLEQFIKLNGHLPEVPKAEEVEKNGVDLGSNQVLLLKKIEELTLISIEQNKKMEKMQNMIENQKSDYNEQSQKISELEKKLETLEEKPLN